MAKVKSKDATISNLPNVPGPIPQASLNIADIVQLLNLVDLASRRGAFPASEMTTVGNVFDKVLNFLKATGAVSEQKPTTDDNASAKTTDISNSKKE